MAVSPTSLPYARMSDIGSGVAFASRYGSTARAAIEHALKLGRGEAR